MTISNFNKTCIKCEFCDKLDCEQRVPPRSVKSQIRELATVILVGFGLADIFAVSALYYFVIGSHQQNESWRAAWDAYFCSHAILPCSIIVAVSSVLWIIALYILCFTSDG